MKKISTLLTILVLIFAFVSSSSAEPVSSDVAAKVGEVHLQAQKGSRSYSTTQAAITGREHSILGVRELRADGTTFAYILDLSPEGCIVISPDTDIYPVIAYSFEGTFSMVDTPDNVFLHLVKWDMENRLEAIPVTSEELKAENNALWEDYLAQEATLLERISSPDQYGPWLSTTWSQDNPYSNIDDPEPDYNKYCPKDPNSGYRSVTGCGATALAQVINYWEYPSSVSFDASDSYTSQMSYSINGTPYTLTVDIDADYNAGYDFPSFTELNQMLSDIKYYQGDLYYFDQEQWEWVYPVDEEGNMNADEIKQDIPALCFACGIAVQMDYSPAGSTATTFYNEGGTMEHAPLRDKFGYNSPVPIVAHIDWSQFYDTLEDNMKVQPRGWPAVLSISGPGGGHFLVADGFNDADGKYHLNLGWGAANPTQVWYSLDTELPQGYNTVNLGILNISPPPQQNTAPDITSTPVTTATQDVLYTYDVDATDPDVGDTLTYSLITFPTGMEINSNTGVIQWTPTNAQVGDNAVVVKVQDQSGATATQSFTITVAAVESVVLGQGWNIISTTLNPTYPSPSSVFSEIEVNCIGVWAYYGNPSTWKRYIPGIADNLGDIRPGRGYLVNMSTGDTLTITGQETTDTDIELFPGLNVVGYNFPTSQSPAIALSGMNYTSIWTYVGGVWLKHIKNASFLDTLTQLSKGAGYCLFMQNGDTWTVP